MVKTVSITAVKANPYQSRKEMGKEGIKLLAEEIKTVGFWGGSLRVREHNSHYELVSGHRRLEALRLNGRSKLDVEIVDLTDKQMAEQALIENVQREGLPEIDKADAIARLIELESADGGNRNAVVEQVRRLLGYKTTHDISQYLQMTNLTPATKQAVRKANTGRGTTFAAHLLSGGDKELMDRLVRRVAEKPKLGVDISRGERISKHELEDMGTAVRALPEARRRPVVEKIASGKLHTPAEVQRAVNTELSKIKPKDPPPDLMVFIMKYTQDLHVWTNRLQKIKRHKAYIHAHPEITVKFRDAAETFISELKDLLNL